jgi:hypothetical protein
MKSKLLVLALSMFAMSFVAANDTTVDAKSVLATGAAVEVNDEEEVAASDAAKKEVAAVEVAEAAKAKKAEVAKAAPQDQKSCKSCK